MKRIVVCLDGTWKNADGNDPASNVVKLRDSVRESGGIHMSSDGMNRKIRQLVYYDEGVGNGDLFDRVIGGATGAGLSQNIRQAYKHLSKTYQPGDEIYLIGFSRGAFTARSLGGYLAAAGLLKPEFCTAQIEARTWAYYRTAPKDRYPAEALALKEFCFPQFKIKCIGVFDTVGALGIPMGLLRTFNARKYQFHDTQLSPLVENGFHAVAIDEARGPFQATLWSMPLNGEVGRVEQCWFAGVHSNIGGGYADAKLSDITLNWMAHRLGSVGLVLDWDRLPQNVRQNWDGRIYNSATWFPYAYSRLRPAWRCIIGVAPRGGLLSRPHQPEPNFRPVGERVHRAAVDRMRQMAGYRPPPLLAVRDKLGFDELPVVNWDGGNMTRAWVRENMPK